MHKLLFALSTALFVLAGCSDDNDDNNNGGGNGNNVSADYSGIYSGNVLNEASGFFGNDTTTEFARVRVYKDDGGHYMFNVNPVDDEDSTKVYFNNAGELMADESINQMGTVTDWTTEASINGTKLDVLVDVVSSVPAAQIEIGRLKVTGILDKE